MSDAQTLGVYNSRGEDYRQMMADYAGTDAAKARFLAACPPPGRVLDLGCGPGAYALHFAEAGHWVDAWDAAQSVLDMVPDHPRISPRLARFDALDTVEGYDGIWAYFSLLHAPRAAVPGHLAAIARALKPGGVLFLGMKLGEGGARDAIGRHYEYYTIEALEDLLRAAGLAPGEHWEGAGKGLAGEDHRSVVMRADA